ncbi:MAG: hypothetical protein ABSG25_05400, partial [Bryobacteraceae bacterium]
RMTCAVDFGGGIQADMELLKPELLWVAVGPGISQADVWMKNANEKIELRVRIQRTTEGIQIAVDRGGQSSAWWPEDAPPQLTIAIHADAGIAVASASVGTGSEFQEVLLGETRI